MTTRIPTQAEYEERELREAAQHEREVDTAPLRERKEAQAEFFEVMEQRPQIIAERLDWLLAGNYGYGAMMLARRVADNPRMNRAAALTQMIAVFEWMCPRRMAVDAWKKLSAAAKNRLDFQIEALLEAYDREPRED